MHGEYDVVGTQKEILEISYNMASQFIEKYRNMTKDYRKEGFDVSDLDMIFAKNTRNSKYLPLKSFEEQLTDKEVWLNNFKPIKNN